MRFVDRDEEIVRLDALMASRAGGLAVVYGRRRVGKTRLLVEWCRRHGGAYAVADQSTPDIQRRYLAEALAARFPGFADVEYRDWRGLLDRLAREAATAGWRGPIVFDELPYWVASSPELPSVLQSWIDHTASHARLVVAVSGSSQRMMQGLALGADAPLYGRARELFEVRPLEIPYVTDALGNATARAILEFYAAWGGVPRYWELALERPGRLRDRIDHLVLDPRGPLHGEPDRLLLEEIPSALEVRPVLDAIGAGAHRVSEIASRIGRPATSLSRPLERLAELGLIVREVPFGEPARGSKRSLYRIADPFTRLWFRVVAPHRGLLVSGARADRLRILADHWPALLSLTWEALCRERLSHLVRRSPLGRLGAWSPGSRWWRGAAPEWDVVAETGDGRRLLLGEAKCPARPPSAAQVRRLAAGVAARPGPDLPGRFGRHTPVRALFVPELPARSRVDTGEVVIVTLADLCGRPFRSLQDG